jgi:hypothetical protein
MLMRPPSPTLPLKGEGAFETVRISLPLEGEGREGRKCTDARSERTG